MTEKEKAYLEQYKKQQELKDEDLQEIADNYFEEEILKSMNEKEK